MNSEFEIVDAWVMVDGHRVYYRRCGQGPALLLLHGLVGSARNWEQNVQQLAQTRTVYALDLLNMGRSDRVAGLDASLEATADRLARILEQLGLECAAVAGHSHGGSVAMMLAARHPRSVSRLVLFAPANPYCNVSSALIGFYNSRLGGWFARRIPALPEFTKRLAHRRMYVDPRLIPERDFEGYVQGLDAAAVEHVLRILARWTIDMAALERQLPALRDVPTLLIWGERDPAVSVESGRRLAERMDARLLVIAGAGHLPFAEQPAACNAAMVEWLAGPVSVTATRSEKRCAPANPA